MKLSCKSLIVLFYIGLFLAFIFSSVAFYSYPGKAMDITGFNFFKDYWCDLYKNETPTGIINPASFYAKLATVIGAVSLIFFWLAVPPYFIRSKPLKVISLLFGVAALVSAALLFSSFHDIVIPLGSALGLIAIFILLYSLRKWKLLYSLGWSVIILGVTCNTIMYTRIADLYLPVLQKIAFIVTIIWAVLVAKTALREINSN